MVTTEPEETASLARAPLAARPGDPRDFVRLGALGEMLSAGSAPAEALDAVTRCLDDTDDTARRLAVEVLVPFGAPAVPALAAALGEYQSAAVRVGAASALGRIGAPAEPAIGSLIGCLGSDDDMLRWHASFALGKIGAAAVPALRQALLSAGQRAVSAAIDSLQWIGPDAAAAMGEIEQVGSTTQDPVQKVACAAALVKISGNLLKGFPRVEELLRSGDPSVRKACVEHMGNLGGLGRDLLPLIIGCAGDPAPEMRAAAALAMARIEEDGSNTVPVLTTLLSDADPDVRANAAIALARYGPGAASALAQLAELLNDRDERVAAVARGAADRIRQG